MSGNRLWTPEHETILIKYYGILSADDLATLLGRTTAAVQSHAKILVAEGRLLPRPVRVWTKNEDRYLIDNVHELSRAEMAAVLNRTVGAVRVRIADLRAEGKIKRKGQRRKFHTLSVPAAMTDDLNEIGDGKISRGLKRVIDFYHEHHPPSE